jgi:hypothetical protein
MERNYNLSRRVLAYLIFSTLCIQISARPLDQSIPWSDSMLRRFPVSFPGSGLDNWIKDDFELNKRQGGSYWYESVSHGISPFAPEGYKVFRNVKDYGAVVSTAFN